MSQAEIVRPSAMGVPLADVRRFEDAVAELVAEGSAEAVKARLAALIAEHPGATTFGDSGLDETHAQIHEQMRRFSEAEVVPHAHEWHLANAYIPMEIVEKVAELGVFGLTLPEAYGGLGLGKDRCASFRRSCRAATSASARSARARRSRASSSSTTAPRSRRRPTCRASPPAILPTAVFTEPNVGSDLASLKTRAVKEGDVYKVTGQKTWITHPVRADLMTLLVRTNPAEPGYKGLSMLLAEKPRGDDADPFPAAGMSGGEIEVLGYRGMKEYDISFDGFAVPASQLSAASRARASSSS